MKGDVLSHKAASWVRVSIHRDMGDPVGAWSDVMALEDDLYPLIETPVAKTAFAWLALVHDRAASLETYFGTAWAAGCDDPHIIQPGDVEGRKSCLAWALCGRHADAVSHFTLSLWFCAAAGLRLSEYPCSQARGLAQRAGSKLRSCTKRMERP